MTKELIISVIIVVVIVVGDTFTTRYTNKSIETTTQSLSEIRKEMEKKNEEEIDADKLKEQIKNIRNDWNKRHKKLAIYIEHDELEKIETNLSGLNGYLDKEEYGDSMAQLDISVYVLEHIKNKTTLSLINIF
ncbi:MAG: DUF4363 family protein [Clostridia bacterium]